MHSIAWLILSVFLFENNNPNLELKYFGLDELLATQRFRARKSETFLRKI